MACSGSWIRRGACNLWNWSKDQVRDAGGINIDFGGGSASGDTSSTQRSTSDKIEDAVRPYLEGAEDILGRIRAATQPYGGTQQSTTLLLLAAAVIIFLVARRR